MSAFRWCAESIRKRPMYVYLSRHKSIAKVVFSQGLVEIWLKEVEYVMLDSVMEQMKDAWEDYALVDRISWVVSWPGQVVLGISCTAWTYEVSNLFNPVAAAKSTTKTTAAQPRAAVPAATAAVTLCLCQCD